MTVGAARPAPGVFEGDGESDGQPEAVGAEGEAQAGVVLRREFLDGGRDRG
jgi:hypothetical protein